MPLQCKPDKSSLGKLDAGLRPRGGGDVFISEAKAEAETAAALPAIAAEQLIKYHNLSNDNATGGGL